MAACLRSGRVEPRRGVNAMRIFDGGDVTADLAERPDALGWLITFSYATDDNVRGEPFALPIARGLPLSHISIVANRNHWWQTAEQEALAQAIHSVPNYASGFRVGYGASMGGYGALLHARSLAFDRVLAVCPQTVIRDRSVPFREQWLGWLEDVQHYRDDIHASRPDDAEVIIMYDPADAIDRAHINHLRERQFEFEALVTPCAGHPPFYFLKDIGLLSSLTRQLIMGEVRAAEARRQIRALRKLSPIYTGSFAQTEFAQRRPELLVRLIDICLADYDRRRARAKARGLKFRRGHERKRYEDFRTSYLATLASTRSG